MIQESTAENGGMAPNLGVGDGAVDRGLLLQQLWGILRLELRRNFLGRRSLAVYFLAFAPVPLLILWNFSPGPEELGLGQEGLMRATGIFAVLFAGYLRSAIFLGALILFMSLFRSEILQRSLHYYLLSPVRREVLVVGKYVAALITSWVVFTTATVIMFILMFTPYGFGELTHYLFQGPGLKNLIAYLGIAVLGCAGYGAVFLLVGLFLRNPMVAAVVIWAWEGINFVLPALLKKFSVIFYLQSLNPVPLPEEVFAVIADPVPMWVSVPGMLLFTIGVLALAGWRARRMELNYGAD